MRKLFVVLLLALGAAFLVMPAFAQDEFPAKLMNARMAQEMKTRAARRGGFGVSNGLPQRGRNAVAPADDADAHPVLDAAGSFGEQVFVQETEDPVDFRRRTFPIR